jgi:hypothetical protein
MPYETEGVGGIDCKNESDSSKGRKKKVMKIEIGGLSLYS